MWHNHLEHDEFNVITNRLDGLPNNPGLQNSAYKNMFEYTLKQSRG